MKSYSLPDTKQLPFRSHLLAKLMVIMREYGSVTKAAKKMGINRSQIWRWLHAAGNPKCGAPWLMPKNSTLIDAHYAICWERREIRGRKEKNRMAAKEEAQRITDEEWNTEGIRQAPQGVPMPFEPPAHAVNS